MLDEENDFELADDCEVVELDEVDNDFEVLEEERLELVADFKIVKLDEVVGDFGAADEMELKLFDVMDLLKVTNPEEVKVDEV